MKIKEEEGLQNMTETFYEWVIYCGQEIYYLSEKQYQWFLENEDKRFVRFEHCMINPAFVSSARRQELKELKRFYPCKACNANGKILADKKIKVDGKEEVRSEIVICKKCKGLGVSFNG